MTPASLPASIRHLPVPDRIELVAAIWDSVAEDNQSIELTESQKRELDRRLAEYEADPKAGKSWQQVKAELLGE